MNYKLVLLFIGLILAGALYFKQSSISADQMTAVMAKDLSLKNYDAVKHNRHQTQCVNEVLSEIKSAAQLGWSSVVFNQIELCSNQKQITTLPHLIKELQARGFQVERTTAELKISW